MRADDQALNMLCHMSLIIAKELKDQMTKKIHFRDRFHFQQRGKKIFKPFSQTTTAVFSNFLFDFSE